MPFDAEDGYATPEEAARGDIPERYGRALSVSVSPDGTEAWVVLGTNEEPYLYPYEEYLVCENGRWYSVMDSNGIGFGWSPRLPSATGQRVGVVRLGGEVHTGVEAVVVRWREREHRVPVTRGYFVFTEWDVPEHVADEERPPQAVRYVRGDGSEIEAPRDEHLEGAWEWLRERRHGRTPRPDRIE